MVFLASTNTFSSPKEIPWIFFCSRCTTYLRSKLFLNYCLEIAANESFNSALNGDNYVVSTLKKSKKSFSLISELIIVPTIICSSRLDVNFLCWNKGLNMQRTYVLHLLTYVVFYVLLASPLPNWGVDKRVMRVPQVLFEPIGASWVRFQQEKQTKVVCNIEIKVKIGEPGGVFQNLSSIWNQRVPFEVIVYS